MIFDLLGLGILDPSWLNGMLGFTAFHFFVPTWYPYLPSLPRKPGNTCRPKIVPFVLAERYTRLLWNRISIHPSSTYLHKVKSTGGLHTYCPIFWVAMRRSCQNCRVLCLAFPRCGGDNNKKDIRQTDAKLLIPWYCWWKKSCTTCDVIKPCK